MEENQNQATDGSAQTLLRYNEPELIEPPEDKDSILGNPL